MIVLALDLATKTGVAVGGAGQCPALFTENLGGANHAARFYAAMVLAQTLIRQHRPDLVAIETPVVAGVKGSADRILMTAGLRAAVLGVCHRHMVRWCDVNVLSVRKHFIGTAKLKRAEAKRAVVDECRRRGWPVRGDDEADAAAIWDYALAANGFHTEGGLFSWKGETNEAERARVQR